MKKCSKCGLEKSLEKFNRSSKAKDGRMSECKSCRNVSKRIYYEKHKAEILAKCKRYAQANVTQVATYKKEWYERNRVRLALRSKEYREANREHIQAEKKAYRERSRDQINARMRARRKANLEQVAAQKRAWYQTPAGRAYETRHSREMRDRYPERYKARSAVQHAIRAGKLKRQPCFHCGAEKAEAHHHKGYAQKFWLDIQWVCSRCHRKLHLDVQRME
jgi:hypothetical protein